jgi:hypothetical protein
VKPEAWLAYFAATTYMCKVLINLWRAGVLEIGNGISQNTSGGYR